MPPVRQKLGPPMRDLLACDGKLRHDCRFAASRRHSSNRTIAVWSEQNDAIGIPRAAFARARVTDGLRRTSRNVNLLQLAFCEKRNGPAVRRPERKARTV